MKKVKFEIVKERILEIFPNAPVNNWCLTPDSIKLENGISFVQQLDYIFINPEQKLITLIHHEGQNL